MPSFLRFLLLFSICTVLFLSSKSASAQNTIHVPTDQPTIQGAINAANNGDTVLVAPGTYYENINFNGKAITVTSSVGAAVTIIDGGQNGSVVTFSNGEGQAAVLNGFTLQNGRAESNFPFGGGIYITQASPNVTNNVIQNNVAAAYGGGIWVNSGSPLIQSNVIRNNTQVLGYSGGGGGGVVIIGTSSAQIVSNKITNNSWPTGEAGGIWITGAGNPTIKNNLIANNSVGADGGGIAIDNGSNATVEQNVIYGGTARFGSGIYVLVPFGTTGPILLNNTIVAGSSFYPQGSSIYVSGFDNQVQLINNILVGGSGQNAVYCDGTYQNQPPIFGSNDALSPSGTGFDGTCADAAGQNGNISADPLFVNAGAGDFHLQPTSPAIDTGTNAAPNLPQTDFAGNPRVLDGNNDCSSTVDMGAYELVRSANVSFSTSNLNFGSQILNTSSTPRAVVLSNTGSTCFQFSGIGITGDFSQANTCSAAGVRGGSSCQFNVTFIPTALGTRLGALTVSGTDGITSANPSLSLSGVGADFSVAASPSSGSVKHGQSAKFTITVSPLGGAFSSAVALSCSGLPTGGSCSFSPSSVTPGDHGATSVMTVNTTGKTSRGNYNVLVIGKSGTDVHSTTVLLSVN